MHGALLRPRQSCGRGGVKQWAPPRACHWARSVEKLLWLHRPH